MVSDTRTRRGRRAPPSFVEHYVDEHLFAVQAVLRHGCFCVDQDQLPPETRRSEPTSPGVALVADDFVDPVQPKGSSSIF